jgi:FkbM family methyltransferase
MISWLENFTKDDVFLDVGANVGTYSIPAGILAKKVISIELDPINVYCLHTNIFLNNLQDKITILPLACGNTKSIQEIFYRDFSMGDALQSVGREQILPTHKNKSFTMQQFTVTIDSLFEDYEIPTPTKIKIDVDGNEEIVLGGAWKTIAQAKEIYFEDNGLDSDTEILAKFSDNLYNLLGTNHKI